MRRRCAWVLVLGLGCGGDPDVAPARGRVAGGEHLRISGEGFRDHGPPVVYVGPRAAKAVVVESASLLTVLTPQADAAGTVDVAIHFADGTRVEYPGAFTYTDEGMVLRVE